MAREHERFAKDVGTWDVELEIRPGPGAPPQHSRGRAVNRLISGGRWLITDFKNETTGFEGHGVYGYDEARKKYVGTWVDDMRHTMSIAEGTWDPDTRTMTYWNEAPGPGGTTMRWRETLEQHEPGKQLFRVLVAGPGGAEFEMMRAVYRRQP